jgi:hypothetical protein
VLRLAQGHSGHDLSSGHSNGISSHMLQKKRWKRTRERRYVRIEEYCGHMCV